jgi:NADPH-dependent 2,4-dienoyl-CoA reductase/sulfur reductase-like enzyme
VKTKGEIINATCRTCCWVSPQIKFLVGSGIETDRGILDRLLQTNVPDVYAIGDCAQQREPIGERKSVEAVWCTGRMMGETSHKPFAVIPWNGIQGIGSIAPSLWISSTKHTVGYGQRLRR